LVILCWATFKPSAEASPQWREYRSTRGGVLGESPHSPKGRFALLAEGVKKHIAVPDDTPEVNKLATLDYIKHILQTFHSRKHLDEAALVSRLRLIGAKHNPRRQSTHWKSGQVGRLLGVTYAGTRSSLQNVTLGEAVNVNIVAHALSIFGPKGNFLRSRVAVINQMQEINSDTDSAPFFANYNLDGLLCSYGVGERGFCAFLGSLSGYSESRSLSSSVFYKFSGLTSGAFHLGDLAAHDGSLRLDCLESTEGGCYAKHANNRKQSREDHVRLFPSRSGLLDDDRYLFMGIVWLLCLPLLGLGFYRVLGRQYRSGWILVCGGVFLDGLAVSVGLIGCLPWHWRRCLQDDEDHSQREHIHGGTIVLQKYLDKLYYCLTVIDMASVLSKDKQIAVVSALSEGSVIRSIERMTGVNRNTIMNLGVRVGKGCTALLDAKMRDLPCRYLQFDEVLGIHRQERAALLGRR
jgi:hypothetical protein